MENRQRWSKIWFRLLAVTPSLVQYMTLVHPPYILSFVKMLAALLEALSQPLEALASASPVSSSAIPVKVDEIWQSAWSASSRQGTEQVDDKQVDLVKVVLEIVGRELVFHPIQSGTVS